MGRGKGLCCDRAIGAFHGNDAKDLIANFQRLDVFSDRNDDTGHITPDAFGKAVSDHKAHLPFADLSVKGVDCGSPYIEKHFVGLRCGGGQFFELIDIDIAVLIEL